MGWKSTKGRRDPFHSHSTLFLIFPYGPAAGGEANAARAEGAAVAAEAAAAAVAATQRFQKRSSDLNRRRKRGK